MQIRWLKKALKNLDDEARYIVRDDPAAARILLKRIHDAVKLLSDNPALGHPGRIHNTRELVVPNTHYVIPYRARTQLEHIEILRVFHTSRKPTKRW